MSWGYHLVLDCAEGQGVSDYDTIYKFTKEMVERIDMKAFGEPQIVWFGEGGVEGYTLVQLIYTSAITAHFNDTDNSFYMDIFSCKPFDQEEAIQVVKDFFKPTSIQQTYMERQA